MVVTFISAALLLSSSFSASIVRQEVREDASWGQQVSTFAMESNTEVRLKSWRQAWDDDPQMFVNCSKVFIDLGSNAGTHIRKLFEPGKYPKAKYLEVFDAAFGSKRGQPSSETGLCAFGFEANPRWASRLQEIEAAYSRKGWRAKWFAPVLVGNSTGKKTFWINNKGQNNDLGASIIKRQMGESPESVTVPQIEFADFLSALHQHAAPGYKLMKMDIEGSEFDVLPLLLEKGLLCEGILDKMTIEWHMRFMVHDADKQAAQQVIDSVKQTGKCSGKHDTQVLDMDDESYLGDGLPLP